MKPLIGALPAFLEAPSHAFLAEQLGVNSLRGSTGGLNSVFDGNEATGPSGAAEYNR